MCHWLSYKHKLKLTHNSCFAIPLPCCRTQRYIKFSPWQHSQGLEHNFALCLSVQSQHIWSLESVKCWMMKRNGHNSRKIKWFPTKLFHSSVLQLHAWLPSLWTEVRLWLTLLWHKPYCFPKINYFVIMLIRYWSLSQQNHLQPRSKQRLGN